MLHVGSAEPSMTKMVHHGVSLGGGGFLGHHQARLHQSTSMTLRKFQLAQCLCRSSQLASAWDLGLCRAQYPPIGNLTVEIGQCA